MLTLLILILLAGLGACSPPGEEQNGDLPDAGGERLDGTVPPSDAQPDADKPDASDTGATAHDAGTDADDAPFDFYFSGGGEVLSLLTGESRSLTLTLERTSGTGVPVQLALSGLPAGATFGFELATPTPSATVTLTITASAETPVGQSTITVTATGGGQVRETQLTLEVRSRIGVTGPTDVMLEPAGTSALVTEADRLVAVDLATRHTLRTIASGFARPRGLAIEEGGVTALLVDAGEVTGALYRVTLATGETTRLAELAAEPFPIAILPGGSHALVAGYGVLQRINLATGATEELTTNVMAPADIAIEEGGATALLADRGRLSRVNLSTGAVSTVATTTTAHCGDFTGSLAIEAAGTVLALTNDGCLTRVSLADGTGVRLSCQYGGSAFALEGAGETLYVAEPTRLLRVYLSSTIETVTAGDFSVFFVALEADEATALILEAGFSSYTSALARVVLATGSRTQIAELDDYYASGLALEPGGASALVVSDASSLLRVALADGAVSTVTGLLNASGGADIALDDDGATALVPGGGAVQRVTLETGAVTTVGADVVGGGIALEVPGESVLLSGMDGNLLQRLYLTTGELTTMADHLLASSGGTDGCTYVALEPDGIHLLVTQPGTYGSGPVPGRLLRVNTQTLAVTMLASGFAGLGTYSCGVGDLAIEADGSHALVADRGNGLKRVLLPPAD